MQTPTTETSMSTAVIIWLCSTVRDPTQIQQVRKRTINNNPYQKLLSVTSNYLYHNDSVKVHSSHEVCFICHLQNGRRTSSKSKSWYWLEDRTMESSRPGSRGDSILWFYFPEISHTWISLKDFWTLWKLQLMNLDRNFTKIIYLNSLWC